MNIDDAWADFTRDRAFRKASIAEKLDTMAAQLQEIQTDTSNTAQVVPKILGDEGAIGTANAEAPPGMGMPPMGGMDPMAGGGPPGAEAMAPPMGGDMAGGEMAMNKEGAPEAPMDAGAPAPDMGLGGGAPAPDAGLGGAPDAGLGDMGDQGLGDLGGGDAGADLGVGAEGGMEPDMGPDLGGDLGGGDIGGDLGGDLGGDIGGTPDMGLGEDLGDTMGDMDAGGATGSGMTLDDVAIELIRSGKREEARVVLEAAAKSGGAIEAGGSVLGGGDMGEPVPPAPEAGADLGADLGGDMGADLGGDLGEEPVPEESESAPESEGSDDKKDSGDKDKGSDKKDDKKDDDKIKKSDELNTDTFAAGSDNLKEAVGEIMGDAVSSIMDAIDDKKGVGGPDCHGEHHHHEHEGHGDDNEELAEHHFEESEDLCKCAKSAIDMSFMDYVALRKQGKDPIGDYFAKSDAEDMETSPILGSGRADLFKKSRSIFEDLSMVADKNVANKREPGVADDIGESKSMGGSATSRGEILDDVDAKKPATTTSREEGLLDENDAGGRSAATKSPKNDMVDDLDERKSAEGSGASKGEILDDIDEVKKSADTLPGRSMMTFEELLAVRKAERPPAQASFDAGRIRPDLTSITKSAEPSNPIRMGHGVDPAKVVEADWEEYKLYKAQRNL